MLINHSARLDLWSHLTDIMAYENCKAVLIRHQFKELHVNFADIQWFYILTSFL